MSMSFAVSLSRRRSQCWNQFWDEDSQGALTSTSIEQWTVNALFFGSYFVRCGPTILNRLYLEPQEWSVQRKDTTTQVHSLRSQDKPNSERG